MSGRNSVALALKYQLSTVASAVVGCCLVGLMAWTSRHLSTSMLGAIGQHFELSIYVVCAAISLARVWPFAQPLIHVTLSIAWLFFVFGMNAITFVVFTSFTYALTRIPSLGWLRHVLVMVIWGGGIWIHTSSFFATQSPIQSILFSVFWVALFYPALLLLQTKEPLKFVEAMAAQLFVVKWAQPYFQPIAPQAIASSVTQKQTVFSFVSALWLFAFGKLCLQSGPYVTSTPQTPFVLGVVMLIFKTYAYGVAQIFTSVGLARAMGFQLDRGTHFPFLANSFSDVYRRWNTYVREAILLLVVKPYYERFGPPKSTTGQFFLRFGAIVVGSYVLNHLLVPLASGRKFSELSFSSLRDSYLPLMVIVWIFTAIEPISSRKTPTRAYHLWFFVTTVLAFAVMHWVALAWPATH